MDKKHSEIPSVEAIYGQKGWLEKQESYNKENLGLIERWRQGEDVFEKIFALNLRMIKKVISGYTNRGLDNDDLYQESVFVVHRCLKSFNAEKGHFGYYLSRSLNFAFRRMIANQVPIIRMTERVFLEIKREIEKSLQSDNQSQITADSIPTAIDPESFAFALRQVLSGKKGTYITHLDQPEGDGEVYDLKTPTSPEDEYIEELDQTRIQNFVREAITDPFILSRRERIVLDLYYFQGLNQKQVAARLAKKGFKKYTGQNISLILASARRKLREKLPDLQDLL